MSTTNASQSNPTASTASTSQPPNSTAQTTTVTRNHKFKFEVPYLDNEGSDYSQ